MLFRSYVDDQKLPLELTIYGAIHQHEARKKKAGNVTPPSMIWQNVYTVKFKKVPGPAKSPEREFMSFPSLSGDSFVYEMSI